MRLRRLSRSLFKKKLVLIMFAGLGIWLGIGNKGAAQNQEIIIVVHPHNPLRQIRRGELSQIYLKKKFFFDSGEKIVPLDYTPAKKSFYEDFLKKKLSYIRRYWIKTIFSGKGVPPREFKKLSDLILFLQDNKGAIAYLPSQTNIGKLKRLKTIP